MYPQIRIATLSDIPAIQAVARQHSKMLGFVRRASLERAAAKAELFVAEDAGQVVGFVNWHARRDGWSTVYEIAVSQANQGQGIGRVLLYSVPCPIRLKCTQDNPANRFYINAGMMLANVEKGRKRPLNVYEMRVLSIIVRGGNSGVPEIARRSGNAYGSHHHHKLYDWPYMVDSDPEHCDWTKMMDVVKGSHPVQALTMDYFPGKRDEMLAQVADLRAAGVLRVAVCPKFDGAIQDIPADCIVAVSLRTNGKLAKGANKYAGFMPTFADLKGRAVHLLGGAPKLQKDTLVKLQAIGARVFSVDGNAHLGSAGLGSGYGDGKWRRKIGEKVNLFATQLASSRAIQYELNAAAGWSQPPLFR